MLFYKDNFKILRESKKLTQEALGKKVFRTRQSIDNYENGKNKPSPSVVYELANALECSVYDISDLKPKDDDPALKQDSTKPAKCFLEKCPAIPPVDGLTIEMLTTWKSLSKKDKIAILGFAEDLKNRGSRNSLEEPTSKAKIA